MSQFYDKSSLVFLPSGYKNSKLYSQKPLSSDGELTFSRASNATRVNSAGLIERVRTNDLLYSQDFSNANWIKSNVSATGGQTDPNGGTTAFLVETTTASSAYFYQANSGAGCVSIYAKAGTRSNFSIINGIYNNGAYFNLSNGTTAVFGAGSLSKIEAVSGGWYRCSVYLSSKTEMLILLADISGGGMTLGDNLYFAFAQAETGDIATDYIATTSSAVSVGPVANVPRLDYLGSSCPRLLLEGQRTNLMFQSENLNASWTAIRATATSNAAISPDGYANADKLIADTVTNTTHLFFQNKTSVAAGTYTYSAFFKKSEYEFGAVRIATDSDAKRFGAVVNLNTGVITATDSFGSPTGTSSKVENYGNGWYRLIVTCAHTSGDILAATTLSPTAVPTFSSSLPAFTGDNTSGIYTWGAQLEAGAYATSYIGPTYSAAVTRVKDAALTASVPSLIGQTEGTLFVEGVVDGVNASVNRRIFSISDGTTSNAINIQTPATNAKIEFEVTNGGTTQALISAANNSLVYGQSFKAAFAYKANDFVAYINGVQIGTDTSGTVPSCSKVSFDRGNGTSAFEGATSQVLLFTSRLSNADLATLTTI